MNKDSEKRLLDIKQKIKERKITLFLGAGCSIDSGLPSGGELTERIRSEFPDCDIETNNFFELCQDIVDTPPYDKDLLDKFITNQLNAFNLSEAHLELCKYDWCSIFTTNYDNIIEVAYSNPDRLRPCRPFYLNKPIVNVSDNTNTYLFKIMGCVTAQEQEGKMVLTRTDYNRSLKKRNKYLNLLRDVLKDGSLVYIGYSFGDLIVTDVINELYEIYGGSERLPWSYALYPHDIPTDTKSNHFFSKNKIIPVQCDFKSFFDFLKNVHDNESLMVDAKSDAASTLILSGNKIEFTEEEQRLFTANFDYISEENANSACGEMNAFFQGNIDCWGAYKKGWDFLRDIYHKSNYFSDDKKCLKDKILEELKSQDVDDNKIIVISGMPGCGKSILGRRIAYDFYTMGKAPALLINNSPPTVDYKVISSFIETINIQLEEQRSEKSKSPLTKPIIIFDDASQFDRHILRLKDWLQSRGRPAIIIAIDRESEIASNSENYPAKIKSDIDSWYEINEALTENEANRLIDHLYDMGYLGAKNVYWKNLIKTTFENSFFATIYSFVHPSQKPLNDIIKSQYTGLNKISKLAYSYTCGFSQFGQPINVELLVRALNCSYEDFISEVIHKEASKIIFEEQDSFDNLLYRCHHKIIAQKTLEFFLPDSKQQFELLMQLFECVTDGNLKEIQLCENIIIKHLTSKANNYFSITQKRELFEISCDRFPTRSLYHHWGLLEMKEGNFPIAQQLLNKALGFENSFDAFRGESDQNILTTIGNLYSNQGLKKLQEGNDDDADEMFLKAEQTFEHAKHGEFPNVHAYHSHGHMWFKKAKSETDENKKLEFLTNALEITSIAKDNLNEDELQAILELETTLWSLIDNKEKIKELIIVLRDKYGSPKGYFLAALNKFNSANLCTEGSQEAVREYKEGFKFLKEGLRLFPNDENLLYLKCKIYKFLKSGAEKKYYEYLNDWYRVTTRQNAALMYELGRTAFAIEYYDISKKIFLELQNNIGIGKSKRSKNINPLMYKGKPTIFNGDVAEIFSKKEGIIKCTSLPSLRTKVPFRPISTRFTVKKHDFIGFNIAFSFRGPYAINLTKK